jgi:formate hydrogenlyase transcriptional activator
MKNNKHTILIIDDNNSNIQVLANLLSDNHYNVDYALSGLDALDLLSTGKFDLILLDIMMPDMDGFEVCKRINEVEAYNEIPIIFLTARTDVESIKRAFKFGGLDYISKPYNSEELLTRVNTHLELKIIKEELRAVNKGLEVKVLERTAELSIAYENVKQLKRQVEQENISLKEEIALSFNYEDLVYSSKEISDVLTQVEQVSRTNATVLLLGETGTGKELVAKAIHNTSSNKNGSLIRVNCAAIPAELLESELFGHKKGSFTGAIKDRIGKFQLADGGTLFLDEIGEMPLALQPKLLRAIQEEEIEPIGSSEVVKLNLRIIAATNKDIEKEVEAKSFRQDLFFRLNVFPITIPPLRERIEDIPVLVDHFIDKFCKKYNKNIESISKTSLQQMKVYQWPGNVRELENVVERAVITSNQDILVLNEFDETTKGESVKRNYTSLEEIQSNHIIKTLNHTQWKISGNGGAAEYLDIKPSTLRDRMKKFGIARPKK